MGFFIYLALRFDPYSFFFILAHQVHVESGGFFVKVKNKFGKPGLTVVYSQYERE